MGATLSIMGGNNRNGIPEPIRSILLRSGESLTVVGPTGSGKSELLADIEQMAQNDTPSGRIVTYSENMKSLQRQALVATLSQKNHFILDAAVEDFIMLHASSLGKEDRSWVGEIVNLANTLCGEPLSQKSLLQRLSGGQTRALMIADIALISNAPVVLIDEVENAGIDKHLAIKTLSGHGKITIIATHDPVLMLSSPQRLVMSAGGMRHLYSITPEEADCLQELSRLDATLLTAREKLRMGLRLTIDGVAI